MDTIEASEAGWSNRATRRRHRSISGEATLVAVAPVAERPARAVRYALTALSVLLVALPITFGGVHGTVYGPAEIAILAVVVALVGWVPLSLAPCTARGTAARAFFTGGAVFLSYIVARGILGLFSLADPHPVLGSGVREADVRELVGWIREVVVFGGAVFAARALLALHPDAYKRLSKLLVWTGVATAIIGLAHWFYDNGRLFWLFEPENVFISTRARWPFVNSNHLACFLLPSLFLLVSRCLTDWSGLGAMMVSQRTGRVKSIADLSADERIQRRIVRLTLNGAMLLAVLLCVIATLSRGVWLGTIVGLIAFIALDFVSRPKVAPPAAAPREEFAELQGGEDSSRRRSGRRRRSKRTTAPFTPSPATYRKIRLAVIGAFCIAVYLFLQDRGAELVEKRIEYGLLHSKEDMRFQLLEDTWPLIAAHPWFGVGVDRWSTVHATVMSPLLAGVLPVYLHNEPAQLLAETGLVGLLIAGWCLVGLLVRGLRGAKGSRDRLTQLALVATLFATIVATAFDFHLRIPAITFQLAVLLAFIMDLVDSSAAGTRLNESDRPAKPS